jgi:ribosome recycling factor
VHVQLYGQRMPLNQVGTVSVPEPRMISVQVWDKAAVSAVDKAIREANLGLNPIIDGQVLRLPIPTLTADRRAELVKLAHKYAEGARVAVRNVRRDGMEALKKAEKDGMSQDEAKKNSGKVQELTDKLIKEIDTMLAQKEVEINKI